MKMKWYYRVDWPSVAFAVLTTILVTMVGGMVWDRVQGFRAFDDRVDCEMQLKKPVRKPLSTLVVCVPIKERRDTLGLELIR